MPSLLDLAGDYLTCSRNEAFAPSPLILMISIALPHFLYAYIWFKPQAWMRLFPKAPVDAFATAGALGKRECARIRCNCSCN